MFLDLLSDKLSETFFPAKPSVVVRPNPVLFHLPPNNATRSELPYRSIFAVLTYDSVIIYDTFHNRPLALARGLHYAGLTDASWSSDGRTLFVTSSDGYISILSFMKGELGNVYEIATMNNNMNMNSVSGLDQMKDISDNSTANVGTNILKTKTISIDAMKSDVYSEKKRVSFGNPLDNRLIEKNHLTVDTTEPIFGAQEVSVNILVAKKKKKVNTSSTPVATM